jgi:hypothetical protein
MNKFPRALGFESPDVFTCLLRMTGQQPAKPSASQAVGMEQKSPSTETPEEHDGNGYQLRSNESMAGRLQEQLLHEPGEAARH